MGGGAHERRRRRGPEATQGETPEEEEEEERSEEEERRSEEERGAAGRPRARTQPDTYSACRSPHAIDDTIWPPRAGAAALGGGPRRHT